MKKNLHRSYFGVRRILMMVLTVCLMVCFVIPVTAASVGVAGSIANISATATNNEAQDLGSAILEGNTIKMMAKGYTFIAWGAESTTTVTITAGDDMTIDYTAKVTSGRGSVGSPSGSKDLSKGETLSFTVKSAATSGEETWAEVTLTIKLSGSVTTTFGATENGTYTVTTSDGGTVFTNTTAGGGHAQSAEISYTVTATAAQGYEFGYWVDATGALVNESNPYTFYPSGNTVKPVFFPSGSGRYYVLGIPTIRYGYLDLAIAAAGETGTVVVCKSGDVNHSKEEKTIKIPSGITLLLPYSENSTSILPGTAKKDDFKHANATFASSSVANAAALNPETAVTYKLTVPKGTILKVENGTAATVGNCGRIVIGGTIVGVEGNASSVFEGVNYGKHSNLIVNGTLDLGNYAVLSAVGYVLGEGSISATGTGAEIYQPLAIRDWRGAGAGALFMDTDLKKRVKIQSGEENVSPYSQWGTVNIQTKLTLKSGNVMYLYASLREENAYCSHPILVGDSLTGGLLQLDSGATLSSEYKKIDWSESTYTWGFPGKTIVMLEGGASIGSMQMSVELTVLFNDYELKVDTSTMTLPVSYCYDFVMSDGDYYIDKSISLLPGAVMTVNEAATLYVGENEDVRFAVFDGLNNSVSQHNGETLEYGENKRSNTKNYPTTAEIQKAKVGDEYLGGDAELLINGGTLVLGKKASFGGLIQTTGSGTVDASAGTGAVTAAVQIGVVGTGNVNFVNRYVAGMSLHELSARLVCPDSGITNVAYSEKVTDIQRGNVYYGYANTATQNSYSYKYYAESGTVTNVILVGDASEATGETVTATKNAHPLGESIRGAWTTVAPVDIMIGAEADSGYATLNKAMSAYNAAEYGAENAYIQINKESPALANNYVLTGDATMTCDTVLNLNGCTVHGDITGNYTLNGFDSATNALGATGSSYGKIVGTVTGSVAPVHTPDSGANANKTYVAVKDSEGLHFHRVRLGIDHYSFYSYNGQGALTFAAAYLGDNKALGALVDLGMSVNGEEQWYGGVEDKGDGVLTSYDPSADPHDTPTGTYASNGYVLNGTLVGDMTLTDSFVVHAMLKANGIGAKEAGLASTATLPQTGHFVNGITFQAAKALAEGENNG